MLTIEKYNDEMTYEECLDSAMQCAYAAYEQGIVTAMQVDLFYFEITQPIQ